MAELTRELVRRAPKVLLHDHLDGGLRPQTIVELAAEAGHQLPADDADALGRWFTESADSGSLERYLETFDHTVAVMQTAENLTRVARECVEDLAADGVVYAEVRYAPEQHLEGGLTLEEVVAAVRRGFEEGIGPRERDGGRVGPAGVGLLGPLSRAQPPGEGRRGDRGQMRVGDVLWLQAVESADKNLQGLGQTRKAGDLLILVLRPQEVVAAVQALSQAYTDFYAATADASSVAVNDPLPSTITYDSAYGIKLNGTVSSGTCATDGSAGGSFASNTVSGTLTSVPAGSTKTLLFRATIN